MLRSAFRAALVAALVACGATCIAQPAVPEAQRALPPALNTRAIAEEAASQTRVAADGAVRLAYAMGVFVEGFDDVELDLAPADAAAVYAERAGIVLSDCADAVVRREADGSDVVVELGPGCTLANSGAVVEGRIILSALEEGAAALVGPGVMGPRFERVQLIDVVVNGMALAGTVDVAAAGSEGIVIPIALVVGFGTFATTDSPQMALLVSPNLEPDADGGARLVFSVDAWAMQPPSAPEPVAINGTACLEAARGFAIDTLIVEPLACAPRDGVVVERRAYTCIAAAGSAEFFARPVVEARFVLADIGPVTVDVAIDGTVVATHTIEEAAALPQPERCR